MPIPYGLYSLADTPEELLSRGYGSATDIPTNQLSDAEKTMIFGSYDPAFGNLYADTRYFPAPYTGARPFQNIYDFASKMNFYDADVNNPSFGGVSGYENTGGIMDIDTDVPAGRGRGTEMEGEYPAMVLPKQKQDIGKFAGIMQETDIDEDESDEVVKQQNWFQKLMNNSLMAKAGGILNAIFRPKQSDRYRPATMGIGSYSPAALNQMNAMGGYYSRPAMDQRSRQNRIANMILRRDADQNYSEKNLANLQAQMSGQPSQAQFATPKAAARSPKVGVSGYTSGDVARESRRGHYG